jgi:hypothetical protein
MKKAFFSFIILLLFAAPSPAAEAVPCVNMLDDLKAKIKAAKLGDADSAKVNELKKKGIDRCKADDDEHADAFFTEALKIISK